jgi:hypothetical protein
LLLVAWCALPYFSSFFDFSLSTKENMLKISYTKFRVSFNIVLCAHYDL